MESTSLNWKARGQESKGLVTCKRGMLCYLCMALAYLDRGIFLNSFLKSIKHSMPHKPS